MSEVFAIKIQSDPKLDNFENLLQCVSSEKQARIKKFRMHEDALRALFGDLLVRYAICSRLKISNVEVVFKLNEYGKPSLEGFPYFHFNISHSGEWVVCVTDSLPVGIDVETIRQIDMGIAKRFFSKDEFAFINSKEICERVDYFFQFWTLKESYIKACGKGLSIPLDSFSIRMDEGGISVLDINDNTEWFFKQYGIGAGYKMAVCSRHDKFSNGIETVDTLQLSKFFNV
ncbi:4'-phosphopantetheinyl transferase family protein [Pseudobacteroides cellulosolvens]|uniref:Phosphopantetheine-protein transferase n=1 Tax=Pseudobacteroides cellulosolvens ATCC 35603 = DSM 2933 TaxID=398512 RepID=A0A0L6JSZ0_9FIRM|nr:4'-phosphopantetheinyl transferase superfamily protein [Pseudobacteroides cellulosolvens]KNY28542.1 phosphopantetheine-protein transferase [Pseudobacteroides cellulosolvens ATCC 35603 = DSM 2933]